MIVLPGTSQHRGLQGTRVAKAMDEISKVPPVGNSYVYSSYLQFQGPKKVIFTQVKECEKLFNTINEKGAW